MLNRSITLFFLIATQVLFAQQKNLIFRHFDADQGLDQTAPYNVVRDSLGYLWICGENGLWRYDGFNFKSYQVSRENPNSIPHNYVWTQYLDSHGQLWLCTYGGGLSRFDPVKEQFTNYKHDPDKNSISNNYIRGIVEDPAGTYWIGTNDGLNKLSPDGQFQVFHESRNGLLSNTVRDINVTNDKKKLHIVTSHGLNVYDLESETFVERYTTADFPGKPLLPYAYVYCVYETKEGILWIGTGDGLTRLNPATDEVKVYTTNPDDPFAISGYVVFDIIPDQDSSKLWVGTISGLNYFDTKTEQFYKVPADPDEEGMLRGNNIYATSMDKYGNLWVGVKDGALHQHNPQFQKVATEKFQKPGMDPHLKQITGVVRHAEDEYIVTSYAGLWVWDKKTGNKQLYKIPEITTERNRIRQITRISDHKYWLTTLGWFIFEWDHQKRAFTKVAANNADHLTFNSAIFKDSKGEIWLGNNEFGLHKWDQDNSEFMPVRLRKDLKYKETDNELVNYIFEDSKGRLWVAAGDGFYRYQQTTADFKRYTNDPFNPSSLSFNKVVHISEDSEGNLWLATESGLSKFDPGSESFTNYFSYNSPLPSDNVTATIEGKNGHIWISTVNGLCRMDPDTGEIIVFDKGDGLPSNQFFSTAVYQDNDDKLMFGNADGLIIVDTDKVRKFLEKEPPKVRITNLQLFGIDVSPGDTTEILNKSIAYTDTITLDAAQNVLTLRFTAFNFVNSYKNKYQYKLDGYDEDWRPVTKERSTTYTNLGPGNYTFRVKASNDMNVWNNQGDSLHIIINPPWYATLWFKVLVGLILLSAPFIYVQTKTRQVKKINQMLEEMVEERTIQLNRQSQSISKTNLELKRKNDRIQTLMKELNHRVKNNLQLVSSLLNLQSHQIKDEQVTRILTAGRLRMQAISIIHQKLMINEFSTTVSIQEYIEELIDNLSLAFRTEEKDFKYDVDIEDIQIDLDQAIPIGLIINELVTNSLKYAWSDDRLAISISFFKLEDQSFNLVYQDDGPGLSEADEETSKHSFGSNLINDLVYQLGGRVKRYQSGGFVIEVTIPNITHLKENERVT